MPTIRLSTSINAPVERVFNLARSINLHTASMQHTKELAIAGKTSGLIEEGESVTWQAKHLFKTRTLTTKITAMAPYRFFTDEMTEGDFIMMKHEHHFIQQGNHTLMTDVFTFQSPYGILGKAVNGLFLTGYMTRLLNKRNSVIKTTAEGTGWQKLLLQP
ncbi:SRPBCC family protein [Foetidibacter luteolus]|uniref:SRPBCC family protein n=1 Tax=Foetidibacter luteolus TaxID=2608880 RepID=UPI00129B8117|nr:SRPBCC family protein [Foetidibacter luteolus]